MVEASEAPEALESGGARLASETEYDAAKQDARYGGADGAVAAAAVGAARGLGGMFGVPTDAAALSFASTLPGHEVEDNPFHGPIDRSAADTLRERFNAYRDLHPYASTAGEIVGMGSAALLGGGLVGGAGRLAAGGASALGLGRIGMLAARGAVETGLYEAGKTANEEALADEELSGEKIVAGFGHGALIGGVLGGGLAGAGELVSGLRAAVGTAAPAGSIRERLGNAAQDTANDFRIKSFGGTTSQVEGINATVDGGKNAVVDEATPFVKGATTREEMLGRVEEGIEQGNAKRTAMLDKLDQAKVGSVPGPDSVIQQIQKQIIEPVSVGVGKDGRYIPLPGNASVVQEGERAIAEIRAAFAERAPTFKQWDQMIRGFAGGAKGESGSTFARVNSILNAELDTAGESAAATMGDAFKAPFRANEKTLEALAKTKEMLDTGIATGTHDDFMGIRAAVASGVGHAIGGPLGGIAGGIAGGLVGKVIQSRGDILAADLLDRVASTLGASRIAARTSAQVQRGVATLVGKAVPATATGFRPPVRVVVAPLGVALTGDNRKDYDRLSRSIRAAASNMPATSDRLSRNLGDLPTHAPKVASAIVSTSLRGLNYLAQTLPPSKIDSYSLQPQLTKGTRSSDAEISRFMRTAAAVEDPMVVFREAKAGTLTRDHVEAFKAVYPNLYDEVRSEVMRQIVETKTQLPYSRRIQLGILLDIPTDATLAPDFQRAIQATYTSGEQAGAEIPPPNLARPINVASDAQTADQAGAQGVPQ